MDGLKKRIQGSGEEDDGEDEHAVAFHPQEDVLSLRRQQGKKDTRTIQGGDGDEIECHEHDIGLRVADEKEAKPMIRRTDYFENDQSENCLQQIGHRSGD